MRKSVCCAAVVLATLVAGLSAPAHANKFSGNYLFTTTSSSYCFAFTNTGNVSGYANSGMWYVETDFQGYFIVSHGKLHLYGTYFVPDNFISADSKLGTGDGFYTTFSGPLAGPENAGTFALTPGC